jgi:hypothetical protein
MKATALKWFLRAAAAFQLLYWGVSHLFFPSWYLDSIGLHELARAPGPAVIFLNEIGVLTIGMAVATWILSLDPVRHFGIVPVLYVVAVGSVLSSLYHISTGLIGTAEWVTVLALVLQIAVVTALYPWRERKRRA